LIQFSHQCAYASLDRGLLVMLPHQPLFDLPSQFDGSRTVAGADSGFELVNEFGECLHGSSSGGCLAYLFEELIDLSLQFGRAHLALAEP